MDYKKYAERVEQRSGILTFAALGTSMALLLTDKALQTGGYTFLTVVPCLLYTSPSPRDATLSRMPSSA